ncbi:MAG: hypothetical protein HXY50_00165 [Ignavibacteriaceae bacterium]|nr:hypothetical protein [Ignavibacteriaceae bacterium]
MKHLQKTILPLLLGLVIFLIYKIYFSAGQTLGSFSDFDPNNSAVKPITVKVLHEKEINQQSGAVTFYVEDRNGQVVMVSGELTLPEGFRSAQIITLKGHLSQGGFHTHEIVIE